MQEVRGSTPLASTNTQTWASVNYFLRNLIAQGEHQQLEFKFEITDAKRIARTLTAFSNTDGGRILIGVKDNGVIAGVRSEEEYYMLQAAAGMYCRPMVDYAIHPFTEEGRVVLVVEVRKNHATWFKAPGNGNEWVVYIRVNDQNFVADKIIINARKRRRKKQGTHISYSVVEQKVMDYLKQEKAQTVPGISRAAMLSIPETEKILTDLFSVGLICPRFGEGLIMYELADPEKNH